MTRLFNDSQQQQRQLIDLIQLPKIELIAFDGDILKYHTFIRAFDSSVGKDSIDDATKLNRLIQYCTGEVREAIETCNFLEDPSEGYRLARQVLHDRFGDEIRIALAWMDKVVEGPEIQQNDGIGLRTLADRMNNCLRTLQAVHMSQELDNQLSLLKLVYRLPQYLQIRWRKFAADLHSNQRRMPKFEDLANFVKVAAEEANHPVFGVASSTQTNDRDERARSGDKSVGRHSAGQRVLASAQSHLTVTSSDTHSNETVSKAVVKICPKCKASHTLFACEEFKKLPPPERHQFVRDARLCWNCLNGHHIAKYCRHDSVCQVQGCGMKHATLLHQLGKPLFKQP